MLQITKLARIFFWLLLAAGTGMALVFTSAFLYLSPKLPSVDVLKDVQLQTPLRIYSADGQLIGEFGEKRRTPIRYEDIPQPFIDAILSAEDDRFFEHHGVDIKGLLRATSQLIATGSIKTGGSTITMQVAKNYFLSQERTFARKFNEILLALQIERELPKEEILSLYLNKIFLGHRSYGIEAAAQVYYGRSIKDLSLAQWAMLAGLPKAPSAYNPIVNPDRAVVRRNWILRRMYELEKIDQTAYQLAVNEPISASYHGARLAYNAPYVAEMTRKWMVSQYGQEAYTAGYNVYTTVDLALQQRAREAVVKGLFTYDSRHGYRGPEENILAESPTENLQLWLDELKKRPVLADLHPAIVTEVEEQAFTALLKDGRQVLIEWQDGLEEVRHKETIDRRSAPAKTAAEIVTIGDLIRLQADGERWRFAQLPSAQAALVSLNADNGAILSLVGGLDFSQSKYNRVTQATRQPGSNFKPFVYSGALEHGFTAASTINDAPIVFDDESLESTWRPTNASGKFFGPTRLRQALFKSRNLVSIRLLRSVGIKPTIDYAGRFGFNPGELPKDLSLALGSHSVTPLSIVSAYAPFANGGYKIEPYLVDRIESLAGDEIYQARPATVCYLCEEQIKEQVPADNVIDSTIEELATLEDILKQAEPATDPDLTEAEPLPDAERIIEARVAYIMDSMLRDVVQKGTARRARSLNRRDMAGKTGTTNGPTDAWFSGYSGGIVTTTWLGYDNNGVLGRREYGGSAALPIWIDYMQLALQGKPERHFKQPEDVVSIKIDPKTGLLARPGQADAIFETFRSEYVPTEVAEKAPSDLDEATDSELLQEDIF